MHLCGNDYTYFSPHCCKCNSFGCIVAIKSDNACHGPHNDSVYSGSEHRQFNSPRLVNREAGFPNLWRALISSNQIWRVNDSPYYREYIASHLSIARCALFYKYLLQHIIYPCVRIDRRVRNSTKCLKVCDMREICLKRTELKRPIFENRWQFRIYIRKYW